MLLAGLIAQPLLNAEPAWLALLALVVVSAGALDRERFRTGIDWGVPMLFGAFLGSGNVLQATRVDRWVAAGLVGRTSALGDPRLPAHRGRRHHDPPPLRPSEPADDAPAGPRGRARGTAARDLAVARGPDRAPRREHLGSPVSGLEDQVAREATAGQAFDDRQGTRIGAALTLVRFVAIAGSVPAWKLMGLL